LSKADIAALAPLIGVWETTIEMTGEAGETTIHRATDTYRWGLGRRFVLHDVAGTMAGRELETLEIIAPGQRGAFDCRSYDNSGEVGDFTARLNGDRWSIRSKALKFDGRLSSGDRTLSGSWMQKRGGKWHAWLAIVLNKQSEAASAPQSGKSS
jgi:hypothetical protein